MVTKIYIYIYIHIYVSVCLFIVLTTSSVMKNRSCELREALVVPSSERVRSVLRSAIRKRSFYKVSHVVNLMLERLIVPDVDTLYLLADCYGAMDPPRCAISRYFRTWASKLQQVQASVPDIPAKNQFHQLHELIPQQHSESHDIMLQTEGDHPELPASSVDVLVVGNPTPADDASRHHSMSVPASPFTEQLHHTAIHPDVDERLPLVDDHDNRDSCDIGHTSTAELQQESPMFIHAASSVIHVAPSTELNAAVGDYHEPDISSDGTLLSRNPSKFGESHRHEKNSSVSPDQSPLFFIDRTGDKSMLHPRDDEDPTCVIGTEQRGDPDVDGLTHSDAHSSSSSSSASAFAHDYVSLLREMTTDIASVLSKSEYAHLAGLYELTTPQISRPRYRVLASQSESSHHGDDLQLVTVECEVQLSLSVQVERIVSDAPVRCTACHRQRHVAAQLSARAAIKALEQRAADLHSSAAARFEDCLTDVFKQWESAKSVERHYDAFKRVEDVVLSENRANLYGAKIRPFGSYAAGLCLPWSDLDIEISLPKPDDKMAAKRTYVCHRIRLLKYLASEFKRCRMHNVVVVESARVPILRYHDREHGVSVDISVASCARNNPFRATDNHEPISSVLVSRILRTYLMQDVRIWQVAMFVKYWSQCRKLYRVQDGFINALGWSIMAVWFMQRVSPPIANFLHVRNVSSSHEARDVVIKRVPCCSSVGGARNRSTTAELIAQFFHFFLNFDFSRTAISLAHKTVAQRAQIDRLPHKALFIEHPVESGVNIVSAVEPGALRIIKKELRRAHHTVVNTGDIAHICARQRR